MSLGLAAVVALAVAAPATAHTFTASRLVHPISESEPGKTKGIGIESEAVNNEKGPTEESGLNQKIVFGELEIFCKVAAHANTPAEGAITSERFEVFETLVKFSACKLKVKSGNTAYGLAASFSKEPIKFRYFLNGTAEFGGGEGAEVDKVNNTAATVRIANKICEIEWPAQKVPVITKPGVEYSFVTYANNYVEKPETAKRLFPDLMQERLVINNALKSMEWRFTGGQCTGEGNPFGEGAQKQEGKTGKYFGAIEEQLVNGNLGYE